MRRIVKPVTTRLVRRCVFPLLSSSSCCLNGGSQIQTSLSTSFISRRFQASGADKKFHCSVCFKSFRLEMAAKLHLQQAHGGDGSILDGAGPGQAKVEQQSNVAEQVVPPVAEEEHHRPQRRQRPTPKPLHDADQAVPDLVMDEMLAVWDKIGTSRLDSGFIHSTMVMKVFAARPTNAEDEAPAYQPAVPVPKGDNPFEAPRTESEGNGPREEAVQIDGDCPFTPAIHFANPFRAGACSNPFTVAKPQLQVQRKEPASKPLPVAEPQEAPKTEFGQLPKFGTPTATPTSSTQAASPFAAAMSTASTTEQAPSPFAAAAAPSSSPFGASPFAAAASPFAAADSPFASSASPFGDDGAVPQFQDYTVDDSPQFSGMPTESKPTVFTCPDCEKTFTSEFGLQSHAHAKHGGPKPSLKSKRREEIPELPAYVPSPVDLSVTSPFGASAANSTSWTDISLSVHAFSASNVTLLGEVLSVEKRSKTVDVVMKLSDGEELSVHLPTMAVERGNRLCVTGLLKLNPQYDTPSNRYYYDPFVDVDPPLGFASVVE